MPSSGKFKVKVAKLAKIIRDTRPSLMVLILKWMKRNTRLELGNKWLMYSLSYNSPNAIRYVFMAIAGQ